MPESILARFSSITDMSDSSTSYRIYIWMATVNMLKDYWFCGIGTGLNAFNAVYPAYSFNAVTAPHSHNLYLQVMCESGICGIVTFLGIIFSFIRTVGTSLSRDKNKDGRIQKIALLSGLGGFLLQGMTDYSFYNYRVTLMFWIFIALGACLSGMKDGSEVEKVD
jgi:putative inorganic carbon (HCO3(-)) transporter